MLVLSRDCETAVRIGPNIRVKVLSIRKHRVKLGIEAPAAVRVWREELSDEPFEEGSDKNRGAAGPPANSHCRSGRVGPLRLVASLSEVAEY